MSFLSPIVALRLLRLAGGPLPPEIAKLRAEIDGKTRAAEIRTSVTGSIDPAQITEIVTLKRDLDRRFAEWAESEKD